MTKVVLSAIGCVNVYNEGSSWDIHYKGQEVFKCTDDGKWTTVFEYTESSSGSGDGGGGHGGTPGDGNVYRREGKRTEVGGTWTKVGQIALLRGDFTHGDNVHTSLKDLNDEAQEWARVPLDADGCYALKSSDREIPGFACFATDNWHLAAQKLKINKKK